MSSQKSEKEKPKKNLYTFLFLFLAPKCYVGSSTTLDEVVCCVALAGAKKKRGRFHFR